MHRRIATVLLTALLVGCSSSPRTITIHGEKLTYLGPPGTKLPPNTLDPLDTREGWAEGHRLVVMSADGVYVGQPRAKADFRQVEKPPAADEVVPLDTTHVNIHNLCPPRAWSAPTNASGSLTTTLFGTISWLRSSQHRAWSTVLICSRA